MDVSTTQPRWIDFPVPEYQRRSNRARQLMAQAGVDLLVCTQRENVEYFSGFMTDHWLCRSFPTAAVVLAHDRDPVLVIPTFFAGNAEETSWLDDFETFTEPHANPRGFAGALIAAVSRLGGARARIGIEAGPHLIPTWNSSDHAAFTNAFADHDIVEGGEVIWGCRTIKSDAEIERIRWLAEATSTAISTARKEFRPGMTELDVATALNRAAVDTGAGGLKHVNIRAGLDRYKMADTLPQDRPIRDGEMLLVDVGCGYRSYLTDMAYISHIGHASDRHHQEYATIIAAQNAGLAALRPGVPACDVYRAVLDVLAESSLRTIDMCGHGIGLDVHEPPMLTPHDDMLIEAGMVFALEPWLYDTDGMGYFCVEEQVLVTADGAEVLSCVDRDTLHEIL